ncbi:MAG: M48 family metallopeptidase [Candidatus Levybacteria bacterium]|nr:M48 family metallopeptidase [Candidatus Levybacteria bacterium]
MAYVLVFVELILLFFLSILLTRELSKMLYRITKNKKLTITILAILFFPGVVVHELAHLIVANLLLVKTGEIEFLPVMNGNEVKLGSVAIAKTDPIRRFFIGAAPIIAGIMLIAGSFLVLEMQIVNTLWKQILFGYILFVIGNTMYSSRKDMEGALELFATIGIILLIGFLMGISFSPPAITLNIDISEQIKNLNLFLLLPIGIDIAVISCSLITRRVLM